MSHILPLLGYNLDALTPVISAEIMDFHYNKHHQTYITNLNNAIKDTEWENTPIETLLRQISTLPENLQTIVRNHGGGHANHTLFWKSMTPGGKTLSTDFLLIIDKYFGSFDAMKTAFSSAAKGLFGSGWTWIVADTQGALHIQTTANQDSPLMQGLTPILGLDVWEHAYYLQYQNRRPDYVDMWWSIVNWEEVESHYHASQY